MTTVPVSPEQPARKALEAFVRENADLERLETLAGQFNIFEAIGAVRQELRHSDFLAFLLDPRGNHGLGDAFAKRLLQKATAFGGQSLLPVDAIDFDVWSLDELVVRREWHYIDILLEDNVHKLVVAIENKIDSSEHSNQLQRAWGEMATHYSGWKTLGLFLTPGGQRPSDGRYIALDYGLVCQLVEELVERRATSLGADVRTTLAHYAQALRRNIVAESEIAELCRRIYQRHKEALDLIIEHRPDQQADIRDLIEQAVEATGLSLDDCSKGFIRFFPPEWDVPALKVATGWTRTGRILLFEIVNLFSGVKLTVVMGPGPESIRQSLFDIAQEHGPPLKPARKSLNAKWNTLYSREFLRRTTLEESKGLEDIERVFQAQWSRFVDTDLPKIRSAFEPVVKALASSVGV